MNADPTTDESPTASSKTFTFGIGNLLMLIAIVAISIAWWSDRNRLPLEREFDVSGPVTVWYTVRTSPTSTSGGTIDGVTGINFRGDHIIVHRQSGGTVITSSNLVNFRWDPE